MNNFFKKYLFYLFLTIAAIVFIGPFLWSVSISFKMPENVFSWPMKLIPERITLQNYKDVWTTIPFSRWLFNSVLIALVVTLSNLFFNSLAGYTFARLNFPGKEFVFMAFLATLMVPKQITLVPSFILLNTFGLINSYPGIFLPGIVQVFGIFLMKQFFETIPRELEEAAIIDGCSWFGVFWRIIIPVSKPAVVVLGIYTFQGNWNGFLWPLIVTTTRDMFTLPVGMAFFRHEFRVEWTILMAGVILIALPTLIIFLIFQKYFTQGITTTGLKQ